MNQSLIKRLVEQSAKAAAAKARIDTYADIIRKNESAVLSGLTKPLPSEVKEDLLHDQKKFIVEHQTASKAAYIANMEFDATVAAKAVGAINAEIVGQVIAERMKVEMDAAGNFFYSLKDDKGNLCDIPHCLNRLKQSPDYSMLFGNGSSNTTTNQSQPAFTSAGVINPWKPETRNLTMQGKIYTADPARAAAMKAEAGGK